MSSSLWKKVTGPSAGLVQQHYVEQRVEALYRRNKDLEKHVAAALQRHPALQGTKLSGDKWIKVYDVINRKLQEADLTINFDAKSWFATENKFETYAQVYERSGRNASGSAQLLGNAKNPALTRADADDKVTFDGLAKFGPSAPQRGLMPGRQGLDRIKEQMEFRANPQQRVVVDPANSRNTKYYADSENQHFNPKTKQVFTALNYGRRPHGSTTFYGASHFVLSPKIKVNALYYAGDTFLHEDATHQAAFHVLGSLVAWASTDMTTDIIQSCYFGARLPNTTRAGLLLEGHVFDELRFAGNIVEMVVDVTIGTVYYENARKFANKHGARLVMVETPKRV